MSCHRIPPPHPGHLPAASGRGAGGAPAARRGRRSTKASPCSSRCLTFFASVPLWTGFRGVAGSCSFEQRGDWIAGAGVQLPRGRRRHLALALLLTTFLRRIVVLARGSTSTSASRSTSSPSAPGGGDDRRLRRARPVALLRLLGADAHADVPGHRRVGRREPHLRRDQVLPLHHRRLAADAARHHLLAVAQPRPHRRTAPSTTRSCSARRLPRERADAGSSSPSRWPSPSRCRSSRCTPGCPTRTSKRRPAARSSWPA